MRYVGLVLPKLPRAFKDLWSQFKRRKRYLLLNPVFDVPKVFQGVVEKDEGHARVMHLHAAIVGSYSDRIVWEQTILCHQFRYTTAREWIDDKLKVVKIGDEQFILQNWPKLKVRPFPDEEFHLVITFPMNHKVKIPYFSIKL